MGATLGTGATGPTVGWRQAAVRALAMLRIEVSDHLHQLLDEPAGAISQQWLVRSPSLGLSEDSEESPRTASDSGKKEKEADRPRVTAMQR